MHLGLKSLQAFLAQHRHAAQLVLATVTATEGSTYRKPGAMMLIGPEGDYAGLVSGGCLEGDLIGHARAVMDDGQARRISYDLKDDDELLLGLGLGCGGSVHLLLVRLEKADDFFPLGELFQVIGANRSVELAMVCESGIDALPLGSAALSAGTAGGTGHPALLESMGTRVQDARRASLRTVDLAGGPVKALVTHIQPSPHVLVCGAGPDALPLVQQIISLGWTCTVRDHRAAFMTPGRFPAGVNLQCKRPEALAGDDLLAQLDAAVVMTHHVGHDATYLQALAQHPPAYVGLLGPRARRDRLLKDIGAPSMLVHGPAGLDIGAELPEAIALAIMAELHAILAGHSGGSLGV